MEILIISLSNIGDAILTTPVIKLLKVNFSKSSISVICGERAKEVFTGPHINELYIYKKDASLKEKFRFIEDLRKHNYDLIIDLRHTLFPYFLKGKRRLPKIPFFSKKWKGHALEEHISVLKPLRLKIPSDFWENPFLFYISLEDRKFASSLWEGEGISFNLGAANKMKRWPEEHFAKLGRMIVKEKKFKKIKIILSGVKEDREEGEKIKKKVGKRCLNLCGMLNLHQLAALFERSKLVISADSGPMHLAASTGASVTGLFGPTDPKRYRPYGIKNQFLQAKGDYGNSSMPTILPEEVFSLVKNLS